MKKKIILSGLLVLALLITACAKQGPSGTSGNEEDFILEKGSYMEKEIFVPEKISPKSFKSEEELSSFISSHKASQQTSYRRRAVEPMSADVQMEDAAMEKAVPSGGVEKDQDYSETNVQEAGIDEADILKTDGEYIYTITDKTLYIVKAYPAEEAEIVSTLEFRNKPESLFIKGEKLAVFGNIRNLEEIKDINFSSRSGATFFNIYDISNREEPSLAKEFKFEGDYYDGRMIDGNIYYLVDSRPLSRGNPPMPIIYEDGEKRHVPVEDVTYFDLPYKSPHFMTVHSINLESNENEDSETITVESGQELYMSENNIYLTYTERVNEYELRQKIIKDLLKENLTESDKRLIKKIKQTDNEVLSRQEKQQKIMEVYESYMQLMGEEERQNLQDRAKKLLKEKLQEMEYMEHTIINKLQVEDGEVETDSNGKVPGHIINQFAMDEKDGVLRIATTVSPRWSRFGNEREESVNNVYTLDDDLDVSGKIEGLAKDESIYSTRFIGEKLYMVTFKQIDPFFVIDLSDPENPKNLGELKIPGFSRYLHPYDEDTIIGIGKNATQRGRSRGLKASLFDVSDFENPEQIATYVTEQDHAQSNALYEHKAFLFSREKNLMVIPAVNREHRWREQTGQSYNGAFVFDIKRDNIELRGLIDHSMAQENNYQPAVQRSLYIEDMLYTKSENLLRINAIDDLHAVENVTLTTEKDEDIPVY